MPDSSFAGTGMAPSSSAAASMAALAAAAASDDGSDDSGAANNGALPPQHGVEDKNPAAVGGTSSSSSSRAVARRAAAAGASSGSSPPVAPRRGAAVAAVAVGGGGVGPSCQVERCNADMGVEKRYNRRHKVCDAHRKASVVLLAGLRQRFCQQCSRFHELSHFDDTKRSCRLRLAGHNERRRRNPAEAHDQNGGRGGDPVNHLHIR